MSVILDIFTRNNKKVLITQKTNKMDYTDVLVNLKKILIKKFPEDYNYIEKLEEILQLSSKKVACKLRGEVQFSLDEVIKICQYFDLSLDSIYSVGLGNNKYSLEMYIHDYSVNEEFRQSILGMIKIYNFANESSSSKYLLATNKVPEITSFYFENIAKFTYIKWLYFNKGMHKPKPLSEIKIGEKDYEINKQYYSSVMNMKRSIYILNINMMSNVIEELKYFYGINFLTPKELRLILKDYSELLDRIEGICLRGTYSFTKQEVSIYYTEIPLPNDLVVVDSDNLQMSMISAFIENSIINKSMESFEIMKGWFYSLLRCSKLITISGQNDRNVFMERQRTSINNFLAAI